MKEFIKQVTILVALMIIGMSASADDSIIGRWVQDESENGVSIRSYYDFESDGIMVQTIEIQSPRPKIDIVVSGKAVYSYKSGNIAYKCEPKDITVSRFYIEGADQNAIDYAIEEQRAEMSSQVYRFREVKVKGDKMTAVYNGNKITLKRVR